MMKAINKRLDDLEARTKPKGGFTVLYQSMSDKDTFYPSPAHGADRGEPVTRAEAEALAGDVLLVEYVEKAT